MQQKPKTISVSAMGGVPRGDVVSVGCPSNEEVGMSVGEIWFANGAPEIGTIVGTYVGVG